MKRVIPFAFIPNKDSHEFMQYRKSDVNSNSIITQSDNRFLQSCKLKHLEFAELSLPVVQVILNELIDPTNHQIIR